jgi:DNA-directed RNA polymerase specialized sigma24 family protein
VAIKNGLSQDDAADVTQSTFAALVDQIASLEVPNGLGGWLSTVARRQSWRLRRSRDIEVALAAGHDAEAEPDPELDDTRWLEAQLMLLPAPCGALLTALFFDNSEPSYAELAVRLGRPVGSIGPTRARCLERLRRVLEDAAGPAA